VAQLSGVDWSAWRARAAALALSVAAGALFAWAQLPLPWMIGPLLAMALGKAAGWSLDATEYTREGGQIVIATALGLYFLPAVAAEVMRYLPWMAVAGAMAIFTGFVGSVVCRALMGRRSDGERELDDATAYFGSIPGGANEMSLLAERFGGRVDRVAFAQSFRILVVVVGIPFAYKFGDIHGLDSYEQVGMAVDALGLVELLALSALGGFVFARLNVPNAFMLGPLAVTIALTATGHGFSAMPGWMSAAAQLCLGCALGAKFERDFFRSAPRFMAVVGFSTLVSMALTTAFAWVLWRMAGIHMATAALAVAPGGIAEMCVTAKVMHLGVPVVTAFQVARVVVLVLSSGVVYRWILRRHTIGA